MKPNPDARVKAWVQRQAPSSLYLTSVSVAEIKFGVGILPEGKRKRELGEFFEVLMRLYVGRILIFDLDASSQYAEVGVAARAVGKTLPIADGYIAAMAFAKGYAVASRDQGPFLAAGLEVINPWD
jgi:predicted nucleic acid-binding protein